VIQAIPHLLKHALLVIWIGLKLGYPNDSIDFARAFGQKGFSRLHGNVIDILGIISGYSSKQSELKKRELE
jgi:hypothetical protein